MLKSMLKPSVFIILLLLFLSLPSISEEPDPSVLLKSGEEFYKEGMMDKAEEFYNRALSIYECKNDIEGSALCNMKLGEVFFTLGLYKTSLSSYDRAFNIYKDLSDKNLRGDILIKKGEIYLFTGNYEDSLKSYREALTLYKETGNKKGQGVSLEHTGDFYYELNSYEEALKYHKEALDLFTEELDSSASAVTICKTGEDYFTSGEHNFGLQKLQEALDIAMFNPSITFDILIRTGDICSEYGYIDEAISKYKEARRKACQDKNKERKAMMKLAGVYERKNDKDYDMNSLGLYEEIINLYEQGNNRSGKIDALYASAEIYNKYLQTEKALEYYRTCLNFYKIIENRWGIIKTNEKMGDIYGEKGQNDLAIKHYEDAIQEIEQMRGKIISHDIKESFSEKVMPLYKKLINFLLKTGKEKEAFNYLEMSRARALLEALNKSGAEINQGVHAELLGQDKKLQAEINYLQNSLIKLKSLDEPDESTIKKLEGQLKSAAEELKGVHKELERVSPSYAFLTGIKKPLTLEEVQKKIIKKDNQYILEYFVNNDKINVWVISKNSFSLFEIPVSEKELNKKIEDFRRPFEALKSDQTHFIETLNTFNTQNLTDLYDILFKPLKTRVSFPRDSELIIVPDGILYYIPFETLCERKITPEKDAFSVFSAGNFLINSYNIVYAPSASTLDPDLLARNRKVSGLYIGFGNPAFSPAQEKDVISSSDINSKEIANLMKLQGVPVKALPETEIQVKNIEKLFNKYGETEVYIREEATEEKAKQRSPYYKYLLFATHGLLDEENPMESSLVFAYNSRPEEDGLLKARDVLNMPLNADLVVLSACETGLGKIKSGEGVIGLTRSFMYAGAPSIIVSLWSVESSSTARLIELFYHNLVSGMNKGEALRKAKLKLMEESFSVENETFSYSHPYFWSSFILFGKSSE